MRPTIRGHRGQTVVESAVLLPFFLLFLFALLQLGHLCLAISIVHYGASSAARQAVVDNVATDAEDGAAGRKFQSLLSAGLQFLSVHCSPDNDTVTPTVTITACASLPAYPFVGEFLNRSLRSTGTNACEVDGKAFGPVVITKSAPYKFIIGSTTLARMNYRQPN